METLEGLGPQVLTEGREEANRKLRELGTTFTLPDEGIEDRILPADWMARVARHAASRSVPVPG